VIRLHAEISPNKEYRFVMVRCTKEEALETRSRILNAAENVFYGRGVAQTSLADIAQEANVTRGAIYWHFKNKSDLFNAMCARIRLPLEAMVEAKAEEDEADPLGQLRAVWVFRMKEMERNPQLRKVFDILFHKCEYVDQTDPIWLRQREAYLKGTEYMEQILRKAIAKKQLPADLDTTLARTALYASVNGLLNNWLFAPDTFNLAANAEKWIDAFIDTLRYAPSLRKSTARP
jgi:TetR/AcrR family transcriptional regulator, acrAB operon repressor